MLSFSFTLISMFTPHFPHRANIITATPGRLEGLFQKKEPGVNLAAMVRSLEVLVLDEADRLLDMGFEARYVINFHMWHSISQASSLYLLWHQV